jgi:predicted glycoside hydrolase/deacetylase ChbG (UPF0249 family)
MKTEINRLIISADDFGINATANRNILELIHLNKIDRVEVLVEGCFEKDEIEQLLAYQVKIDIHLNSTEKVFPRLSEKRGIANRSLKFATRYLSGKSGVGIVKLEWEKQIDRFQSQFGKMPDGLSSHEHVHFLPAYFKIIIELAQKHNIPYLRFGEKSLLRSNSGVAKILGHLHKKDAKIFPIGKITSSDYFASLDWLSEKELEFSNLPPGEIEIGCHPERAKEFQRIIDLKK